MARTLTLKNLPDALHARLAVEQQLTEIRALRESLGTHSFDPAEIDALKREGRPWSWWTPTWWPRIGQSLRPSLI